jgi:hypothetical protein
MIETKLHKVRTNFSELTEIHSRAHEGRSTHIRFPAAVERHVQSLTDRDSKDGGGGRRGGRGKEDEDVSVGAFLDAYAGEFGVTRSQLQKTRVLEDGAGESRFYHLEQYIGGYRVFGGSMVVSLDGSNGVLGAHGHPMPESAIEDRYQGVSSMGAAGVVDPIMSYLRTSSSIVDEYGVVSRCDSSSWVVETVWYREDIVLGGQGSVTLVDRVEGTCVFVSGTQVHFEAFGE